MTKKVKLVTLGCPKNDVDSEVISRILLDSGHILEDDADNATTLLINTCGFIEDARRESLGHIADAIAQKRAGKVEKVIVAGCLVARCGNDLGEKYPDVDAFFTVSDFDALRRYFNVPCWKAEQFSRYQLTPRHYAYLKIAEGCDYKCSFCAIPSLRGVQKSRSPGSLVEEAHVLADAGVKELILIAEDITRYGKDTGSVADLCSLLRELRDIPGLAWIRLLYAYPGTVSDSLIELIGSSDTICNYIDIPVQHISDSVLQRMNRTYRRKHIERLIRKLRDRIPGIALRTTVIVGFPGEIHADFIELSDFLMDAAFDRLGVFMYSDEKGTASESYDGKIDRAEIIERYEEIRLNQDMLSERANRNMVGKTVDVLIDRRDESSGLCEGRLYSDAPGIDQIVHVNREAEVGEITAVTIEEAACTELFGK